MGRKSLVVKLAPMKCADRCTIAFTEAASSLWTAGDRLGDPSVMTSRSRPVPIPAFRGKEETDR